MFHNLIHNPITKFIKRLMVYLRGAQGQFVSLEDIAHDAPNSVQTIYEHDDDLICSYPLQDFSYNNKMIHVGKMKSWVVRMKDVSCFSGSDVLLLANNKYFCISKQNQYIGKASDCSDGHILTYDRWFLHEIHIPYESERIESGISIQGLFSFNYYHFTYQIIPRMQYVEDLPPNIPLLVDEQSYQIKNMMELLALCNKSDRPIKILRNNIRYCVHELYYFSEQTICMPNYNPMYQYPKYPVIYISSTLDYIKSLVEKVPQSNSKEYPSKIFLSRRNASGRRTFNEEECIALTQRYGYKVICPENYSIKEQISLFHNAKVIIGGTGAAFTNLIYCSNGCHVIVFSKWKIDGLWSSIIDYVGGRMVNLSEQNINPKKLWNSNRLHESFTVDINKLECILRSIEKNNEQKE